MGYDAYETSLKRPPQQPAGGPMVGCAMRQWVIASLLPCIVMVAASGRMVNSLKCLMTTSYTFLFLFIPSCFRLFYFFNFL